MDGFICQEQDFELDSVDYWEPMESFQNRCDVIKFPGASNKTSGTILGPLQEFEL